MKTNKINDGTFFWITGLSGAGKTTVGNRLYYEIGKTQKNVVILDGDVLKKAVSDENDTDMYSDKARRQRAMKYAKICKMLADQGLIVICCTIAMYDSVREWNRKNNKRYVEVFLDVPSEVLEQRDQKGLYSDNKKGLAKNLAGVDLSVEFPKNPDIVIKNDGSYSVDECVRLILDYRCTDSSDFDRDTLYWNSYYSQKLSSISNPSPFGVESAKKMKPGRSLLELGCGNGRDSLYFAERGLIVTGIDASAYAIDELRNLKVKNTFFICDDFVCAQALFTGQFDYCYSRFSIHAINEDQETELINNVYNVLKIEGMFFIEVRSIHDELYGKGKCVGRNAYFYDGHYRRFVDINELETKLQDCGFDIVYSEESKGFAPFGDSDPYVIRIICRR